MNIKREGWHLKTRIGGIRGFLTKLEYSFDSMSKHQFDGELDEIIKLIDILRDEASRYYKEKSFDQQNKHPQGLLFPAIRL